MHLRPLQLIFALILLLSSAEIYSKPNLLLQCLAKEEEDLHKSKNQNALFRLNQEFVNELASSNDITIKNEYVSEICRSKTHSASVTLLKQLLLNESNIYDLSFSGAPASMRPFKLAYINEFQKQVPRIFVQYISGLQSEMATPDCLNNAIPELVAFNEKLKYLEEELSTRALIPQKNRIEAIFNKLRNIENIKKNCEKIAMKKTKKLLKGNKKENANLSL